MIQCCRLLWLVGLTLVLVSSDLLAVAIPVEIEHVDGQFTLHRGGEPYFIKGGGGESYLGRLAARGGNSVRTWGAGNAEKILNQAHQLGLTVTLGLWVKHEANGFDYNDADAVNRQLDKFRKIVAQYKDHPALLMWGIGNEVNLNYHNPKVWDAIEEIAAMIHEVDRNHPTMTVLAGLPRRDVSLIVEKCPNIDVLGVNAYGALKTVPRVLRRSAWDGPYVVTEWANNGYWEVGQTSWGAAFEPTSNQKAEAYLDRYKSVIAADTERGFGAYVFYWGNAQELTQTWFGMFLDSGEETSAVDVMEYAWTGSWPENRAPNIVAFTLDGTNGKKPNAYLRPSAPYRARVSLDDSDEDSLKLTWEVRPEVPRNKAKRVTQPIMLKGEVEAVIEGSEGTFYFDAPDHVGAYRLYVYAFDGHNHTATANVPFFVRDTIKLTKKQQPRTKPALNEARTL